VAVVAAVAHPLGGRDYPRTLREFNDWFPDEAACGAYLARLRWPDTFVCPRCGGTRAWWLSEGRFRCAGCRGKTSVTAGTIFADTRLPLKTWFAACWYVTSQKPGVSALGLRRVLGLGSYETAWSLLHKLRRAMVGPGRDRLAGEVEVDESYVGGPVPGKRGRGALGKAIAVIAVEVRPRGACGRARLTRIPNCSQEVLSDFVCSAVGPGAVVYTDHWSGYNGLGEAGFTHHPTNISASGDPAHVAMPRVHRVASLLKRWLLGTHHGGIRVRHLDFYLDEWTFRFNRRHSRSRGMLFYRLLEQAVQIDHVPVAQIIGGHPLH
jgi:transposase-like protein